MHTLLADRLRLVDRLGTGGTGTVWRAWDRRRRTFVAAKILPLGHSVPGARLRLDHPHVISRDETLTCATTVVHLMRLVRGGTTDRLLADHGALPAAYVAVLLDQLLDALSALHAAGWAHRDVKPANLLLEPTGTGRPRLWLGDLDVAARLDEAATTWTGTDGYLAPEIRPGSPVFRQHDLYATGITAVELLTGRVPRESRDLLRSPLSHLLLDLVAADPDRRPATADEARTRLRAIGVPDGAPWQRGPRPPHVPARTRRLTLAERWRLQCARAAQ